MPDLAPPDLIARTDRLFEDKRPYEAAWTAVRQYMAPDAADFNRQDVPGATNRDLIVSGFGEAALDEAAETLVDLACNVATRWKGLAIGRGELPVEMHAERVWLEAANDMMLGVYADPRSRFVPAINAVALDQLAFGTSCMYLVARPGDIPIFEHRPLAEIAAGEGEDGFVDECVWEFEWTAKQAFQKWGGKLPEKICEAAADAKKCHDKFKFRHYVYPRSDYDDRRRDARARRFRECWIAVNEKALIDENGFFSFPYIVGRANKRGSQPYGRGRAIKALADVKMLQRVRRSVIQGAEKIINPPTQSPDDGVMGAPDLRPGMDNPVRPEYLMRNAGIQPITTGARPDIGLDFEQAVMADIDRPLLGKARAIPREPRMVVNQIIAIEQENMRAAAKPVGEFQTEVLGPLDARLFDIMQREGAFGPAPASLAGAPVRARLESPAARAQELGVVGAVSRYIEIHAPLWQANPENAALLDWDTASRDLGRILGMPANFFHAPETVEQMRAASREVAAQREQREAGKDVTTMMKNATPAMALAADNENQGGIGALLGAA